MTQDKMKVTFADVAGVDEAKEELEEIIEFLKEPKRFTSLGGRIRRAYCCWAPRVRGRPSWQRPWPERLGCLSSACQARTSSRCSSASGLPGSVISLPRESSTPHASSSSTRSMPWEGTAGQDSAGATTNGSRP